jgi:Family of unknown function (DUF6528)
MIVTLFFTLLCILLSPGILAAAGGGQLVVCGWDEVFVFDLGATDNPGGKIWSWRAKDRPELPAELHSRFATTDECKPVDGGRRILITSSSDGVALVDYPSGNVVFHATAPNAHSAELLPGGRIAVAASHRPDTPGDRLILFDIDHPGKPLFHTEVPWAHGAVWDKKRQILWALADEDLHAYTLKDWDTDSPSLALEAKYRLPDRGGHDLYPAANTSVLTATTGKHCWLFDRDTREFTSHPALFNRASVKCITMDPATLRTVWVQAEGGNWWSERLRFLNPTGALVKPGQKFYKARWMPR